MVSPSPFQANTSKDQGSGSRIRIRIKDIVPGLPVNGLIRFSANTSSKHGLPHPPADPPLVPRQPHHPPDPTQRRSFKRRPPPTRGEEKVRTVVVSYTERRAHTKLSKSEIKLASVLLKK